MNQGQQPASGQEVIRQQNLSQETSFQLDKTLCELQRSLIEFTSPIKEDQNETPRRFNSECPGKVEYEIIRGILKQQKQLLQQECNEGKDTSQRKLVLDLLRSNWRYLLFKSKSEEKEQLNTVRCSRFHQRDTRDFQEQNDNLDRDIAFKQHLGMLISYLTDLTAGWRINDPQTKRYFPFTDYQLHLKFLEKSTQNCEQNSGVPLALRYMTKNNDTAERYFWYMGFI